jgi:polysaccharide pyruvyl transferase WcaK-like protein
MLLKDESAMQRTIFSFFKSIVRKQFKSKVAIWGWWQGENLGDNWIKECMIKHFSDSVFIDTHYSFFQDFAFVICGGGGLFIRDVGHQWERKITVPFGMIGLGAEFEHPNTRAQELSQQAHFFFVRDKHSLECMHLHENCLSYDITFSLPLPELTAKPKNTVLFIWREPDELFKYTDFCEYIGNLTTKSEWRSVLEPEFNTIKEDSFFSTSCNIENLTDNVNFIVSARYHGIVAAIQRAIPCIGIDVCPKVRSLMVECGLEDYCIKIGDLAKLKDLIAKSKKERNKIRSLQRNFTKKANAGISSAIKIAKDTLSIVMEKNDE